MADLNALIAQGYQFQPPSDPFVQYGRMQQLEQGQQANQLNRMKMQEAERANLQANMLNQAYASSVDPITGEIDYAKVRRAAAAGGAGSQIPAIEESRLKQETARLTQQKTAGEVAAQPVKLSADKAKLLDDKLKLSRQFLDTLDPADPNAPARYLAWHEANYADPDIGPALTARGVTAAQARAQIDAAIARGPQAFAQMLNQSKLGTEKFMEMNKPTTQVIDQSGQRQVIQIPGLGGTPTTVGTYADVPLPANVVAQKKEIARAGASNIGFKQEGAFETGLGKGQSDRILANQVVAQDAAAILETNQVGRDLLKAGAITGTGADFLVGFNNALKQAGVDFGYADAASNSQAYAAAMGANVGRIIKQFGAGTGLSDADREYAAQMAGGKISLTEASLRKILEINDRAANRVIDLHNKNVSGIKTNIPLTVEKPTFAAPPPSSASLIPGSTPAAVVAPQGAIDALKAGKGTDAQFDAIFGAGAAKRAKGGK